MPDRARSPAAVASAAPDRLSGRLVGARYRIGERIAGRGVMPVFRAVHAELGRPCAVKVIRPTDSGLGVAWRVAQSRFRVEALAGARLDHPNVLRVLDCGREQEDGLHYLVTEPLEGLDLAEVLAAEGPLSTERVARIGRGLCAALQHAHERGVVHRDIRPENVRLVRHQGDDGRVEEEVKLLDFGAALITGEDPGDPEAGAGDATAYRSPEQAAGAAVDARSDLYALGALLLELAGGCRPGGHAPGIPIDPLLETILRGCLRPLPAERPGAARDVRDALGLLLARPEAPHRSARPRRRVTLLAVLRWGATLAGIAGAIALWGHLYVRLSSAGNGGPTLEERTAPTEPWLADAEPGAVRASARQVLRDAGAEAALDGGAVRASRKDALADDGEPREDALVDRGASQSAADDGRAPARASQPDVAPPWVLDVEAP